MPDTAAPTPIEHLLALKSVAPFSSLPPDDLALLIERAEPRTLAAGDVLVPAGVPLAAIHLLMSGRLEEERNGQPWAVRTPYELVGGVDALAQTGERVVVRATAPTETLELDRDALLEVCLDRFGVLATVATGVAARAIAAHRRLGPNAGYAAPTDAGARAFDGGATPDAAEIVARLHASAALGGTPIHTLAYAAAGGEVVTLEPGHVLWRAGDAADDVLLVLDGRVDCTSDDDRQRFTLGPGEAPGLLDALAGVPRWYGAVAAVRTLGLRLSLATLLDVLEDDPETAVAGLIRLARTVATLVDTVADRRPDTV